MSTWGWPQITYLALTCIGLGVVLSRHGESRNGEYHFGASLIARATINVLLYCGGFWS